MHGAALKPKVRCWSFGANKLEKNFRPQDPSCLPSYARLFECGSERRDKRLASIQTSGLAAVGVQLCRVPTSDVFPRPTLRRYDVFKTRSYSRRALASRNHSPLHQYEKWRGGTLVLQLVRKAYWRLLHGFTNCLQRERNFDCAKMENLPWYFILLAGPLYEIVG